MIHNKVIDICISVSKHNSMNLKGIKSNIPANYQPQIENWNQVNHD